MDIEQKTATEISSADAKSERWTHIPKEMRALPQWVVAGANKAPRTADGSAASATDPSTWCDFETASRAAQALGLDIGYVLHVSDPFTCIDLDVKGHTPQEVINGYRNAISSFDSYAERSRSGNGFHIWILGNIGAGRRRDGVEVYSQQRYIICTGDVVLDRPIASRPEQLAVLLESIGQDRLIAEQAPTLLDTMPASLPLLSWVVLHHAKADLEQRVRIRDHISRLTIEHLEDGQVLNLAKTMTLRGVGDLAVAWLPRIESICFDSEGNVRNRHAAELVADLYLLALRYEDSVRIRQDLLHARPHDAGAVLQYAKALFESGDREAAYRTMEAAVIAGSSSSRLILNWAMLASPLGHRREAHRLLSGKRIEINATPEDYARLLQAHALLGVRGHHDEVLAGLRQGFVTPDNAGMMFGLGLYRRTSRNLSVDFGTIIKLQISNIFDDTVCLDAGRLSRQASHYQDSSRCDRLGGASGARVNCDLPTSSDRCRTNYRAGR